jgi:Ca2+-binding RTX toxin-like protein
MAKPIVIKKVQTDQIFLETSNNIVEVAVGGAVLFYGDGYAALADTGDVQNNLFKINGDVVGYTSGVNIAGDGSEIVVGKSGSVQGQFAVHLEGPNQTLTNNGTIRAILPQNAVFPIAPAVYVDEVAGATINNNGLLFGLTGISVVSSTDTLINNGKNGIIIGEGTVFDISNDAAAKLRVVNKGTIQTLDEFGYAIDGGAGAETIINRGHISGIVELAEGNDSFDIRGGTMTSSEGTVIFGGTGDDTLVTAKSMFALSEDADGGTDTVKSTATYALSVNVEQLILIGKKNIDGAGNDGGNFVYGNAGNNTLSGLGGVDVLRGFGGDDIMYGGGGGDFFVFGTKDGKDTIGDFEGGGTDLINLSAWKAVKDFDDLLDHAKDKNGDVVITAGKDRLTIENITEAELSSAFFIFDPM